MTRIDPEIAQATVDAMRLLGEFKKQTGLNPNLYLVEADSVFVRYSMEHVGPMKILVDDSITANHCAYAL